MKKIKHPKHDHYYDVSDDPEVPEGVLLAHMAHSGGNEHDFLLLYEDAIVHRWGRSIRQVQGQTFSDLTPEEVEKAKKSTCLFSDFDVWY